MDRPNFSLPTLEEMEALRTPALKAMDEKRQQMLSEALLALNGGRTVVITVNGKEVGRVEPYSK